MAKRARARGGHERRRSAAAARRGLKRGDGRRIRSVAGPIRGAAAELRRVSRLVEQKLPGRQRLRHLVFALAGLWALWTFLLGGASLPKLWATKHQNDKLVGRIEVLQEEEARLRVEVHDLEDPRSVDSLEKLARDELGMVRRGEKLVRFYEEDE